MALQFKMQLKVTKCLRLFKLLLTKYHPFHSPDSLNIRQSSSGPGERLREEGSKHFLCKNVLNTFCVFVCHSAIFQEKTKFLKERKGILPTHRDKTQKSRRIVHHF